MSQTNSAKFPTVMLCLSALFTALMAIGAWISIPMASGISVTLQLLVIMTCAALLPETYALLSILVYVLLGLVGVPVFAGFKMGVGVLAGPTGGYIIGFIPAVYITALLLHRVHLQNPAAVIGLKVAAMALGVIICYAFGTVWFMVLRKMDLATTLTWCVLPYIPFDALKIAVAVLLSTALEKPLALILRKYTTR